MKSRHGRRLTRRTWLTAGAAIVLVGGMALSGGPAQANSIGGLFELDGNPIAGAAPGDDWSTLLGAGVGTAPGYLAKTSPMPIADSDAPTDITYFTGGGSKDVQNVSAWQYSSGDVAPDKDEILNAFASAYLTGAAADPPATRDLILNFGADRFANSGDAQMGFWFFRNPVSLGANGHFNGVHTAPAAASGGNPAHGGDLLVLSDFSGGGSVSTINVYEWVGGKNPLRHLDVGGASVDCANGAHNEDVCATENSQPTASAWAYTPKAGVAGSYPTGSFLEGGINVSDLVTGSDLCFSTFLAETRSSTSTTAQLKDFALGSFALCAPSTSLTASPPAATPQIVHSGDDVTFTFTETNDSSGVSSGGLSMTNVSVTTNNSDCVPAYTSGDGNSNGKLDVGETWTFTCTLTNVTADVTIVATGHGTAFGKDVTFCAAPDATKTCDADERASAAIDVINPSTVLTKTASASVTYTFAENNDGDSAISSPTVTDDKCTTAQTLGSNSDGLASDATHNVGDLNNNNKLDPGETWYWTCTQVINGSGGDGTTVTNLGTGSGVDVAGETVTWCANPAIPPANTLCDQSERDSVTVTVKHN